MKKNRLLIPFIITQIGASQNEFILADDYLWDNKGDFSKAIYNIIDNQKSHCSFLRCFAFNNYWAYTFYWYCNITEELSGRHGLYVITGILVHDKIVKNYDHDALIFYLDTFYKAMESTFEVNFADIYGDCLFTYLQTNTEMKIDNLISNIAMFSNASRIPLNKKIRVRKNQNNLVRRSKNLLLINWNGQSLEVIGFFLTLKLFVIESQTYIIQDKAWDISTNGRLTAFEINVYLPINLPPSDISSVELKICSNLIYLVLKK